MSMKMIFGRWLEYQMKREGPIGELARCADEDIAAPKASKSYFRWVGYLQYIKANEALYDGLRLAWAEWQRGENFPSAEKCPAQKQWAICHLDREYAQSQGDPVLAMVMAEDQREALTAAKSIGLYAPSGLWAYQEAGGGSA